MALDKNDGTFLPSIEGVVSGKTSQVDGMNGIMNNLIGNDNYLKDKKQDKQDNTLKTSLKTIVGGINENFDNLLDLKDKKLDRGNYVGNGELLSKDDNGIWGGEYGGKIQDPIPKELNKRYIDNINGKAFICIKAGDSSITTNTIEYFTPCNVVDNLNKINLKDKIEWTDNGVNYRVYRNNNTVIITSNGKMTYPLYDGSQKVATIPDTKFFPLFTTTGVCVTTDSGIFDCSVSVDGEINVALKGDAGTYGGFLGIMIVALVK